MNRILPTLLLSTAIAGASVAPAAAASSDAGKPGVRKVCAPSSYVKHRPGVIVVGTLFKHQTIKVERYDKSGKHAYGFARGHVNKHGWVLTAELCK
jgi:hypothetical protein